MNTQTQTPTQRPNSTLAVLSSYADYLDWLAGHLDTAQAQAAAGGAAGYLEAGASAPLQGHDGEGHGQSAADAASAPARNLSAGDRFQSFDGAPQMVVLPAGAVEMGAHPADPDAQASERPRRHIILAQPFAVSLLPVTFEQWDVCVAEDGTRHRPSDATWGRGDRPVMNVSWHDAQEYVGWLSRKTGERYRLLTEAEWEYACWAGVSQAERYPWGADLGFRQLRHHAWHSGNAEYQTHPAGQLQPNAWGLSDMLGNVAEWVADSHHRDLSVVPADGTAHQPLSRAASRVFKGGSWLDSPRAVRPSARDHFNPDHRSYRVGFRVAMEMGG